MKTYFRKKNPGAPASFLLKNLCDPEFPLYFLLRNLNWLQYEKWWKALSPRSRRVRAARIVAERVVFFSEVKRWKRMQDRENGIRPAESGGTAGSTVPEYCDKCGLCCEVASGLADFPCPCGLPERWQAIFANGLGKGHRFCPFLWEDNGSGGSTCSIYPWRSIPCRLFESDECDFFWRTPEPAGVSSEKNLLLIRRWLANLVNARKLPLASADVPAKSPEFLKLDRI
jgi:hypothetical protein